MKKIISVILLGLSILTLSACGASETDLHELKENLTNEGNITVKIKVTGSYKENDELVKETKTAKAEYVYEITTSYAYVLETSITTTDETNDGVDYEEKEEKYSETYYDFDKGVKYYRTGKTAEFSKSTSYTTRTSLYNSVLRSISINSFLVEEDDKEFYVNSFETILGKSTAEGKISMGLSGGYTISCNSYQYDKFNDLTVTQKSSYKTTLKFETANIVLPIIEGEDA